MRAVVGVLLLVPAIAAARPAGELAPPIDDDETVHAEGDAAARVDVDVTVDVAVEPKPGFTSSQPAPQPAFTPPGMTTYVVRGRARPIAVVPVEPAPAPPRPPRRWVSLAGTFSVGSEDAISNRSSQPAFGARLDVDLAARDAWRFGVIAGHNEDQRFTMYGEHYDGAEMTDTKLAAYAAAATRRGRLEARAGAALGIVSSDIHRWSSKLNPGYDEHDLAAIAEVSGLVSIDIAGNLAFGIGAIITYYDQTFESTTGDAYTPHLHRGVDLSLQSSLRWALE